MADFCLSCRTFGHCTNDCHLTCELDVPTAREADAPSEELLRIGGLMANTMFNLAQRESLPIRERASFKDMQIAWDAARRAAPRIASMEAQAVAWQCRRPGGSWGPPFTKQAHVEIFLADGYEVRALGVIDPSASTSQAQVLTEKEVDWLLMELDDIARTYDIHDYGLPLTFDEPCDAMREKVRAFAQKNGIALDAVDPVCLNPKEPS